MGRSLLVGALHEAGVPRDGGRQEPRDDGSDPERRVRRQDGWRRAAGHERVVNPSVVVGGFLLFFGLIGLMGLVTLALLSAVDRP